VKQTEHLFQFSGQDISMAAHSEANYHENRLAYWREEQQRMIDSAKNLTAVVEVSEYAITGGRRVQIVANITGVQKINDRLVECGNKIEIHRNSMDEYRLKARAYGTQVARTYELDPADVVYFRLASLPREEQK
jgi:hypothetical protein